MMDEDERQDLATEYYRYKNNEAKTKMITQTKEKKTTRYLSPIIQVSFCNVWTTRIDKGVDTGKYDITGIMDMPKNLSEKDKARWNKIKELMLEAKKEKWPKLTAPVICTIRRGPKAYQTDDFFS